MVEDFGDLEDDVAADDGGKSGREVVKEPHTDKWEVELDVANFRPEDLKVEGTEWRGCDLCVSLAL